MDKFLETEREVFTQFCTDGKIFYLQCFQACRNRNNCVSATGNDIMSNTSSASVAKEIKSQKYFTNLYWRSLTFPLVMMINNVHLSGLGDSSLRSSQNTIVHYHLKGSSTDIWNQIQIKNSIKQECDSLLDHPEHSLCTVDMAEVCPPTQRSQTPAWIHIPSHGLSIMARCVSDWQWWLGLYCKLKAVDVQCDQSPAFPLWKSPNWMSLNPPGTQYCLHGDVQAPEKIRSSGMSLIWISCDWFQMATLST